MRLIITLTIAALCIANVTVALAAGGGSTGAREVVECREGLVYDERTKKCVPADEQSLDDRQRLENGIALAYADRFDEAVNVLTMIEDKNDPQVLNYLGYATRNAGDLETGLGWYRKALALDPDYTLARSYMGQALLVAGDRRAAMEQLAEIEKRDGATGEPYTQLATALMRKSLGGTVRY